VRPPALEAHELSKTFASGVGVHELTFEAPAGAVTSFLGENGAGKTTTLRLLLDLALPDSGGTTVAGRRYRDLDEPLRTVGAVLEGAHAHPSVTARDCLRVTACAADIGEQDIDSLLERVGLEEAANRPVGAFSLGMRQRLGLARALLPRPDVLIFDEPFNGLDPRGIRWLRELIRAEADAGRAVFLSTHMLGEAEVLADHLILLHRGRIVAMGTPAEVVGSRVSLEEAFIELTGGPA